MGRIEWNEPVKLDSEVIVVQGSSVADIEECVEFHTHRFHMDFFVHTVTVTRSQDKNEEDHYIGAIVFHRRDKERD